MGPFGPKKENIMRHDQIKKIVFTSILIALILFLSLVFNPFTGMPFGFIPLGTVAVMTIIHIPVLIGAIILGKKFGMILGFTFGLGSLITAASLLGINAPWTNPLLSILPRIFLGYITVVYYDFFKSKFNNENFSLGLTLGLATLTHTLIVVPLFYLVAKTGFYFTASENPFTGASNLLAIFTGIFTLNGLIEILLAILVGLPIIKALKKVIKN